MTCEDFLGLCVENAKGVPHGWFIMVLFNGKFPLDTETSAPNKKERSRARKPVPGRRGTAAFSSPKKEVERRHGATEMRYLLVMSTVCELENGYRNFVSFPIKKW